MDFCVLQTGEEFQDPIGLSELDVIPAVGITSGQDPQAHRLAGVRRYEDMIVSILAIYLLAASDVLLNACLLNGKGEWLGVTRVGFELWFMDNDWWEVCYSHDRRIILHPEA